MEKQRKEDEEREKDESTAKPVHKVQMTPITAMSTSNLAKVILINITSLSLIERLFD